VHHDGFFPEAYIANKAYSPEVPSLKRNIEEGIIQINCIHTDKQQANILIKPVKIELFPKL
jgi:hypothetical protein